MKILPVIFSVSLAINLTWLGAVLWHSGSDENAAALLSGTKSRLPVNRSLGADGESGADGGGKTLPVDVAIRSGSAVQLRDALRSAGIEEDLVRSIVKAYIWRDYRRFTLNAPKNASAPWWKPVNTPRDAERVAEQKRLSQEARDEETRVLGEAPAARSRADQQYGFLPQEKREPLNKLLADYRELEREIRTEARGSVMLPSDVEKLRYLDEEKRKDMEALLTPEEFRDYELRNSQTASSLRWRMGNMDATEEEFVAIYDLQKEFDERYNVDRFGAPNAYDSNFWQERRAAEKALNEQVEAALGEARYRDYRLASDGSYQQLKALAERLSLPPDTPGKLYTLRETVPAAAVAIADDNSLTNDQKRERLAALADRTRQQLEKALGSEGAEFVQASGSFNWVRALRDGHITIFNADGSTTGRMVSR